MAEHAVNSVTSAVTNEITSRVFSGLVQRYGKDAATSKKLQRLEMLLIKINSAIEASEKITIENSWLLLWRDKLKEAASRGDEVLASFPQCTNNANGDQQQGEAVSSTSAAAPTTDVGPLSFTKSSLSGMVQGIRNAKNILFSSVGDDMVRLNTTLGSLEQLSPDLGEFIRFLHLEALPKVVQTPHIAALSTKLHGPIIIKGTSKNHSRSQASNPSSEPRLFSLSRPKVEELELRPPTLLPTPDFYDISGWESAHLCYASWDLAVAPKEQPFKMLQDRLKVACAEICMAVEVANSHDLEDLEWLTYWAGILGEAKEQGHDVLGTTSACKTINTDDSEELTVECDQEEDELNTFVHRLEGLARDVEYFNELVDLCPTR